MIRLKSFFLFRYWAPCLFVVLSLLGMWLEIHNNRFELNDLRVYYRTAERLIAGHNLYRIESDIFYIFKYSPVAGIFFIPLTIFSFYQAKVIYWVLLTLFYAFSLKYILELASGKKYSDLNKPNALAFGLGIAAFIHISREAHLGQVNFMLCLSYILSLGLYLKGRTQISAFLLAVSLFFKPFGLILLLYLGYKKHFRQIVLTLIYVFILGLLPFLFYQSIDLTLHQYKMWFAEMMIELMHKKDLMQSGNHTIFSVVFRHLQLGYLLKGSTVQLVYVVVILLLLGLLSLQIFKRSNNLMSRQFVADYGYLMALIPLLSYTSRNAFIFTMLLLGVLLVHFRRFSYWQRGLLIAAIFFIGGNNIELLGPDLTYFLEGISIVSIGTMVLILLLVLLTGTEAKK